MSVANKILMFMKLSMSGVEVQGDPCTTTILAYFTKMKVGLSNRQPVCVFVYSPLITFEEIGGFG
jgi:hypothetical protein